jgi:cytochrome oxidase assembly protein ShyY1
LALRLRRPSRIAWLLLLAGLSLFLTAGVWQWQRGIYKDALYADFDSAFRREAMPLGQALNAPGLPRYQPVLIEGRWIPGRELLLDNRTHQGVPGVWVYSLFQPEGLPAIYVQRGWIPWRDRRTPPVVPPAEGTQLRGLLAPPPAAGLKLGADAENGWPRVVTAVDLTAAETALGTPLLDSVLLPAGEEPGFVREFRPQTLSPDKHRGYAVQWFSFAVAAIVLFLVLHREGARP